jgi:hypothetical protein
MIIVAIVVTSLAVSEALVMIAISSVLVMLCCFSALFFFKESSNL